MATKQILGKVMITNKGEYESNKTYEILDVVSFEGSSYVSKENNNSTLPTSGKWQLLAKKGDTYELKQSDFDKIVHDITEETTSEFNKNASAKTNEFNNNATTKTNTFNSNVNSKTSEFNSNASNKTNTFNSNADSKKEEFNTNVVNKTNEFNAIAEAEKEEIEGKTESIENHITQVSNELERVKNDILETGEASDSYINLEDSTMAEYQKLSIDGVCKQVTTTGKNLANTKINGNSWTYLGITITYDDATQELTVNGTATGDSSLAFNSQNFSPISVNSGEKINLLVKYISGTCNSTNSPRLLLSDQDYTQSFSILLKELANDELNSKTLASDLTYNILRLGFYNGDVFNNLKIKVMVCKDDDTSYEPYSNLQPSPSPIYQQPVKTIENSIDVISCNSNLIPYPFDDKTKTVAGITFTDNNDGTIGVNGINDGTETSFFNINFKNTGGKGILLKKGTYTLDLGVSSKVRATISEYDNVNNVITGLAANTRFKNFEMREEKRVNLVIAVDRDAVEDTIIKPMLYMGSQPIDFEENQETITTFDFQNEFLGKIDETIKDELSIIYNEEDGEFHKIISKKVGKYQITGNENWTKSGSSTSEIFVGALNTANWNHWKNDENMIICDYLTWSRAFKENSVCFYNNGNNLGIRLNSSIANDISEFKNWLTVSKPYIYYILETPYTIDLGVVDMPITYDTITNLFTNSELNPKITATYYRNFLKTVQNLQVNDKGLQEELIEIKDRLNRGGGGAIPSYLNIPDKPKINNVELIGNNTLDNLGIASKSQLNVVESIAKGKSSGRVFNTEADMRNWLKVAGNVLLLNLGDNLYIRDVNVPDYWWDGTEAQELETQKVDLTEYIKKTAMSYDEETETLTITI